MQTGPEANPPTYSMTTGVLPRGQSGQDEKLTIHLRLVSRLRINRVIPLVPSLAVMAWPGKTRPLFFFVTFVRISGKSVDRWLGAWVQNY